MNTTLRRSNGQISQGNRARETVAAAAARRDPLRRRWGRIGTGLAATILGAWVFAALYVSSDDTAEVLVMASDVGRFETIERSDLRVVGLPANAQVSTVPANRLDDLVGRLAGSDLAAGVLLTESQLVPDGQRLVDVGEAVVGVLVGPGDSPSNGLRRGADVSVVIRPPAGVTGEVVEVAGWVLDASGEVLSNQERPIELVVARPDAAAVSAAAADRRVTIVVLGD